MAPYTPKSKLRSALRDTKAIYSAFLHYFVFGLLCIPIGGLLIYIAVHLTGMMIAYPQPIEVGRILILLLALIGGYIFTGFGALGMASIKTGPRVFRFLWVSVGLLFVLYGVVQNLQSQGDPDLLLRATLQMTTGVIFIGIGFVHCFKDRIIDWFGWCTF